MPLARYLLGAFFLVGDLPRPPQWYEQVSGIIAIPVTIVGAAYSYVLIKKTRLESRKTELEIREKLIALEKAPAMTASQVGSTLSSPLITFSIGSLLLRYVLLELILWFSRIVSEPLSYLFKGLGLGVYYLLDKVMHGSAPEVVSIAIMGAGTVAGSVLYWLILFTLGWPLFKDILVFFGVSTKSISARSIFATMWDWRGFSRRVRDNRSDL